MLPSAKIHMLPPDPLLCTPVVYYSRALALLQLTLQPAFCLKHNSGQEIKTKLALNLGYVLRTDADVSNRGEMEAHTSLCTTLTNASPKQQMHHIRSCPNPVLLPPKLSITRQQCTVRGSNCLPSIQPKEAFGQHTILL